MPEDSEPLPRREIIVALERLFLQAETVNPTSV